MTKEQCTAIINAICKTAEYLAIVNVFDDKTIAGAATSEALDPLNTKFETDIATIVATIPDDPAPEAEPGSEET